MDLLIKLREGSQSAYTEVYNRFKLPLYTFLWERTHDREIVRDILHDVFLTIWEKRADIQYETSLSGYLFSSVKNRLLDCIARDKVKQRYIDSFYSYINATENTTDHLIRTKELSTRIAEEIADLPPKTREVFELSRTSHLSRKEIASKLGVSEETVKSHMYQALKTLKLKLGHLLHFIFL